MTTFDPMKSVWLIRITEWDNAEPTEIMVSRFLATNEESEKIMRRVHNEFVYKYPGRCFSACITMKPRD
jgi:hypothetical protein